MRTDDHFQFYGSAAPDGRFMLDADEARHATRVLRLGLGDSLRATDGTGSRYTCQIEQIHDTGMLCQITGKTDHPPPNPRLHVYVGLPERPSFEGLLSGLGPFEPVRIVPLICDYCQERWWDGWLKQQVRMMRILVTALKQSHAAWMPELAEPVLFDRALGAVSGTLVIADQLGATSVPSSEHSSVFIGPPGGFSAREASALANAGAVGLCLGQNRLRTELAATIATAILRLQDNAG